MPRGPGNKKQWCGGGKLHILVCTELKVCGGVLREYGWLGMDQGGPYKLVRNLIERYTGRH